MRRVASVYSPVAFGTHRPPLPFPDPEFGSLTGTDLIALMHPRELAARGHDVTIYAPRVKPCTWDGVTIKEFEDWKDEADHYDVAIAVSNPNCLSYAGPKVLRCVNRQVAGWGIDCKEGFDEHVDLYLCPSESSVSHVSGSTEHKTTRSKYQVLPDGCYPEQFDILESDSLASGKKPGSVAYISSPDRGLHLLLQAWPEIRRRVPHAELRIYYESLVPWIEFHCDPAKRMGGPIDQECTRRALYIRNALRHLEHHGVTKVGGVSHRQLVKELCSAEVLAYPCSPLAYTETFSVAVLEACAAGCATIISSADCLEEVHGHATAVVRAPVIERMGEFADLVVRGLTEPGFRREFAKLGREHAKQHDWRVLAERLEGIIERGIEAKKRRAFMTEQTGVSQRLADAIGAPRAQSLERPRIDLVLTKYGSGEEPIDIDRPFASNSGGGCRIGYMGLVRALPALGYDVRAYSTFAFPKLPNGRQSAVCVAPSGIQYIGIDDFKRDDKREVLLGYYDTSVLIGATDCLRVGSHHTFSLPAPGSVEWTDLHVAPSQYAVDALRRVYDTVAPWAVMPNGLQPDLPKWKPAPGRCLWPTSASRGLWHLLEMWPEIERHRPGSSLHIVGDVAGWLAAYDGVQNRQGEVARRTRDALYSLPKGSQVKLLGKLTRADMLREIASAACFPFSFESVGPTETFSVAAMECLAVGVPVVMMKGDALESIYSPCEKTGVWLADSPKGVLEGTFELLGSGGLTHSEIGREFAAQFTFANKAAALDRAIRESLRHRSFAVTTRAAPRAVMIPPMAQPGQPI